ncbi:hypothetical protein ACLOJK_040742 [Asimina triloba]
MPDENRSCRSFPTIVVFARDFDNDYRVSKLNPPNPEAIAAEPADGRSFLPSPQSSSWPPSASSPSPAYSPAPPPTQPLCRNQSYPSEKFCSHTEFEIAFQMTVAQHVEETGATNDDPHEILLVLVGVVVVGVRKAHKEAAEISAGEGLGVRWGWAVGDYRELLHFSALELEGCRSELCAY